MAHYAQLDENDIVTMVFVGKDENEEPGNWEQYYGAKRTSYNTRGGIYYDTKTNKPHINQSKAFRKNYACVGYKYDIQRDAFIPPKPTYESWTLNENTCLWEAPVPYPNDEKIYDWDEDSLSWKTV